MSKINIMAIRHSVFYSPLLITMAGGYLHDLGLDAKYVVATPENTVVDNIKKGQCHLAQSAVATSFSGLERGEQSDLVHFAQINARDGFFITSRVAMTHFSWSDLEGKKVLVDHFFQPLSMLKFALKKNNVDYNKIEVLDAGDVAAIDKAFREGTADYVHQQGPAAQQLEQDGIGFVVASVGKAVGPVAFSSLCASRAWLKTDMSRTFMRAYHSALEFVIQAPAEEIAALEYENGYFPGIDKKVLINSVLAYKQLGCWEADPVISQLSYERLLDVFIYDRVISQRYNFDDIIVRPPGM